MIDGRCEREAEVLAAVGAGRWPQSTDRELVVHAAGCRDCADTAAVAGALSRDRRVLEAQSNVPPSGAVWWRMQLRRERELREEAARVVSRVHALVVSFVCAAIVLAVVLTPVLRAAWNRVVHATGEQIAPLFHVSLPPLAILVLAGAAWLIFTPVAVYLAMAKD